MTKQAIAKSIVLLAALLHINKARVTFLRIGQQEVEDTNESKETKKKMFQLF